MPDASMTDKLLHWDIFCRVIDNYGDIGVCWRLARQLAKEHQRIVRLWVDDLASLQAMCSAVACDRSSQLLEGVEIRRWDQAAESVLCSLPIADAVIEAFACELPEPYLLAMVAREQPPVWFNLEYLTAESWAESCHALASPHPRHPLTKYFFFPGFTDRSGGLLRERGLLAERQQYQQGLPTKKPYEISLFAYREAPYAEFLTALAAAPQETVCHVPAGQALAALREHLGGNGPWMMGSARILPIPFLSQAEYDHLLWRCDLNFVRGEDSFIRAQWAGRPFIWQAYRQDDGAHLTKLSAFLDRYCAGLSHDTSTSLRQLFDGWNTGHGFAEAFRKHLSNEFPHAELASRWSNTLAQQEDLASSLLRFASAKV